MLVYIQLSWIAMMTLHVIVIIISHFSSKSVNIITLHWGTNFLNVCSTYLRGSQ